MPGKSLLRNETERMPSAGLQTSRAAPAAGYRVQFRSRVSIERESEKVAGAKQLGPTSGGGNIAGQALNRPGCRLRVWESLKGWKANVSRLLACIYRRGNQRMRCCCYSWTWSFRKLSAGCNICNRSWMRTASSFANRQHMQCCQSVCQI